MLVFVKSCGFYHDILICVKYTENYLSGCNFLKLKTCLQKMYVSFASLKNKKRYNFCINLSLYPIFYTKSKNTLLKINNKHPQATI